MMTFVNCFTWTNSFVSQNDTLGQLLRSCPFYDGETKIQKVHTCSRVEPRESDFRGHALSP